MQQFSGKLVFLVADPFTKLVKTKNAMKSSFWLLFTLYVFTYFTYQFQTSALGVVSKSRFTRMHR